MRTPDELIETLKTTPETYKTIVSEKNNNELRKLKRKISWYIKNGYILSGKLPGKEQYTILFSPNKKYEIFTIEKEGKNYHLYAEEYKTRLGKIIFADCHILNYNKWIKAERKIFNLNEVKKWM